MNSIWEEKEQVQRFAERDPDHRLVEIATSYTDPQAVCVFDLGCAGGRNSVYMARLGFDVYALDASQAMVEETRRRLAAVTGPAEARKRVVTGRMDDLSHYESAHFDLIIALGILHNATSRKEWDRSLSETSRLLKPGGRLLLSNFGPRSQPHGPALVPHPAEPHVYDGFGPGPMFLLESAELDEELSAYGLKPLAPTETVKADTDEGFRYTINGFFIKD